MYQLKRTQFIPTDLQTCWDFFSSPKNLQTITPAYMGFDVLTYVPEEMYEGLMIAYKIKPIFRIPMNWVTEIKYVHDLSFFVDEQRYGPYKMWHHEHHFKAVEGGVEMTDIVSYELPLGFIGRFFHPFIVKKKLEDIFDYRFQKVAELFGELPHK
jgi:ligand-binding SRPBCC domain-containing protein